MGSITFEQNGAYGGYITFITNVISGKFSGSSSFCISKSLLNDAIETLCKMYNELKGIYQMNDYDSDDFVLFEFMQRGHLKISGQVGGSHCNQYLVYEFMTDQTALCEIISSFRKMISEC